MNGGDLIDQIEIVSASIVSYSVLILIIGVLWSPFAALICEEVASDSGKSAGRFFKAGALHSILLFFPWVYLLLSMHGKSISNRVVWSAYGVLYLACLLGPILFNVLLAREILGLKINYPDSDGFAIPIKGSWTGMMFGWLRQFSEGPPAYSFESTVFWITGLLTTATLFYFLWFKSLSRLTRLYCEERNRVDQAMSRGLTLPNGLYLEPFKTTATILFFWLVSLMIFVQVGMSVFGDCTLSRPTHYVWCVGLYYR